MTPGDRALFERARAAAAAGRLAEALDAADALCASVPEDPQAAKLRALLLTQAGHADATAAWQRVAALAPRDAEAHFQLGNAAGDRGDFSAAVAHLEAARALLPVHPLLLNNLGLALEATGRLPEAIERFGEALKADPRAAASVRPSLARVLFRAGRYADALPQLDALLAGAPRPDPAWRAARAACLAALGRDDEALDAYRSALAADRQAAAVWHDLVRFLLARGRIEDADVALTEASDALPDDTLILSLLVASRQRRADWREVAPLRERLIARVRDPDWTGTASGYDFATLCDEPALQRRVAQRYAASEAPGAHASARLPAADAQRRVRLGFVSSDYRDHPVGRLVVALLARLDRGAFELVAYSTGASDDTLGARIASAVDRFAVLPRRDAAAAARTIRADAIDVLFDLNGFSGGEALRLFATRPAPLQINFLGYTGTLGSTAYDAIVTDTFCIAPDDARHYVERPLYVEPCYLPSDPARAAAPPTTRAAYGLPEDATVLHAGGALYKVSPELFAAWLALLRDVPDSVLWLRDAGAQTTRRLAASARAQGIAPERLRFAPSESVAQYLARFALADLLLDTWPFGSHTTLNDALFMGVPAVTIAGRSFAGRASASQLRAAGQPDLAAADLAGYVALARSLALDRDRLQAARAALRDVRRTPLFAADAYAARFADAVMAAWRSARR